MYSTLEECLMIVLVPVKGDCSTTIEAKHCKANKDDASGFTLLHD